MSKLSILAIKKQSAANKLRNETEKPSGKWMHNSSLEKTKTREYK